MHIKIEKPQKHFENREGYEVMIRIKLLNNLPESFKKKKKGIWSQGPFPFFNNKMEHPPVK